MKILSNKPVLVGGVLIVGAAIWYLLRRPAVASSAAPRPGGYMANGVSSMQSVKSPTGPVGEPVPFVNAIDSRAGTGDGMVHVGPVRAQPPNLLVHA